MEAARNSDGSIDVTGTATKHAETAKRHSKKAADIVKEQLTEAAIIAREAVYSGAYVWPVQGHYVFFTHPTLLKPLLPAIIPATLVTICVTILLFVFTYIPTVAVMAFFSGPLAFFTAIPVILGEGAAIGFFIAKIVWLGPALTNLFDEVLVRHGLTKLVSKGREMQQGGHGQSLGKIITKPLDMFSKENIIRWIISIPLNAIPVVGTALFFLYNGARSGPSYHARYFELKSLQSRNIPAYPDGASVTVAAFDKEKFVHEHRGSYSAFGAVAMGLTVLIPGGVIFSMCGNQVGAALWAAEMEKADQLEKKAE